MSFKIVFMGTPRFAIPILKSIYNSSHKILEVYSQPPQKKNPIFLINPEIIYQSKETSLYEEGCLSLPGQYAEIERPAKCKIKYIDYNGKKAELEANGLLSTCVQHEIDHLNGILFVDYLSKLKKDMIIKKLKKQKKELDKAIL